MNCIVESHPIRKFYDSLMKVYEEAVNWVKNMVVRFNNNKLITIIITTKTITKTPLSEKTTTN